MQKLVLVGKSIKSILQIKVDVALIDKPMDTQHNTIY